MRRVRPLVGRGYGGVVDQSLCFNPYEHALISGGGNLPHWNQKSKLQFVTFRLADSLPLGVVESIKDEIHDWMSIHKMPWNEDEYKEYNTLLEKMERWLDRGHGECCLSLDEIQSIMNESILFLDGKKYDLYEYVIMPNHVHLIILPYTTVEDAMHSLKSFTANKINKILGRKGSLWQRESFDRLIRSVTDYKNKADYIKNNPNHQNQQA